MQDHLFTGDLMALRKRRANVASALRLTQDAHCRRGTLRTAAGRLWRSDMESRLVHQYRRTFYHLTVIELRLTDKVSA